MSVEKRERAQLSRRDMLRASGVLAAGGLLAACAAPQATTQAPTEEAATEAATESATQAAATSEATTEAPTQAAAAEGHVVIMRNVGELTDDMVAQFQADHSTITVEALDVDLTRLIAMYAAGNPPDLVRVQAPSVPQYLARDMLYDLTPYFEASTLVKLDDLAPSNDYYKANSPLEVGSGPIYGMTKDWSPDFTIFVYKKPFEDKSLDVPSDTEPMTYDQVRELGAKLATFEGDRTVLFGFDYDAAWIDRMWSNHLLETDNHLYSDDFTQIQLTDSDEARKVVQFYFDMAKDKVGASPINPSPNWVGDDFDKGLVGLLNYGYWFGAMAETDVTKGQVIMIPGPTWAGVRRDPTITATGMIMTKATKVPDAAWVLFEWFNGGQPADDRAASGWGVPALKSQYDKMPNSTDFDKQRRTVLQGELDLATAPLQFNPYHGETTVADAWQQYAEQALNGQMSFDDMLANIEQDVNTAIQDGKDAIGS